MFCTHCRTNKQSSLISYRYFAEDKCAIEIACCCTWVGICVNSFASLQFKQYHRKNNNQLNVFMKLRVAYIDVGVDSTPRHVMEMCALLTKK